MDKLSHSIPMSIDDMESLLDILYYSNNPVSTRLHEIVCDALIEANKKEKQYEESISWSVLGDK